MQQHRTNRPLWRSATALLAVLSATLVAASEGPVYDDPREADADRPTAEEPESEPALTTAQEPRSLTRLRVDRRGVGALRVDSGSGLDRYAFNDDPPLVTTVHTAPYGADQDVAVPSWGPVDADGHPAPGNAFFGGTGKLTARAFDVDDDFVGSFPAEIDQIIVNGTVLPGALSGADNQWSLSTFDVPLELLVLPTADDPLGTNVIEVDVDTGNDVPTWAVEVDWLELRLTDGLMPVAFAHGLGQTEAAMGPTSAWYRGNVDGLANDDTFSLRTLAGGSTELNADIIERDVKGLRQQTGAQQVSVVAHSKGGLDTRRWAFEHPGQLDTLVMMGTPNGGSEIADYVCIAGLNSGVLADLIVRSELAPTGCDTGYLDPVLQTTTVYVQGVFNREVRDVRDVDYFNISGQRSIIGAANLLEGEDDGAVTVASTRFLARPNGLHSAWPIGLEENHQRLIGFDWGPSTNYVPTQGATPSAAWPLGACRIYTAATVDCSDLARSNFTTSFATATTSEPAASPQLVSAVPLSAGPGETASLPVDLEGVPAVVTVAGVDADVATVEVDGLLAQASGVLGGSALTAEIDGVGATTVELTNTSDAPVEAILLVQLTTPRGVTVDTGGLATAGGTATVTATVTAPAAGDKATAVLDGVEHPMAATGAGEWSVELPVGNTAGHGIVVVRVGPDAPRFGAASISVAPADVASLVGTFGETVERAPDGRIEVLELTPSVDAAVAGDYRVVVTLRGADGTSVASASGTATLPAGTASVPVRFTAEQLSADGVPGPWEVVDVLLLDDDANVWLDETASFGFTAAYSLDQLARNIVVIDEIFTDEGRDTDGDGDFDQLLVTGAVDLVRSGTYAINARLVDATGDELDDFQTFSSLPAGRSSFTMTFDGNAIGTSGADGPYRVVDLSVYEPRIEEAFDYLIGAHATAAYRNFEFDGGAATLASLRAALERARAAGEVTDGIARSLDAKLEGAEVAFGDGRETPACNKLDAFGNELEAQDGKGVTPDAADRLRGMLLSVIARDCT